MSSRIIDGDCRAVLPTLPAGSVQCVVTSPPYFGLRDYGVDGQIGLEASPDAYVTEMVAVFREVRRVLRDDGTVWLNLGDSYAAGKTGRTDQDHNSRNMDGRNRANASLTGVPSGCERRPPPGYKPKDLLGMPWRVALALQADGWWLRSAIVWHKPNPMPESVRDRPTSAYEMVFMLAKQERYYYDADAVRETAVSADRAQPTREMKTVRPNDTAWHDNRYAPGASGYGVNPAGRSCRNVWTIATHPYSEAHFATFPPELAERCIKAGTSERGCCAQCGAPWARELERKHYGDKSGGRSLEKGFVRNAMGGQNEWNSYIPPVTTGWRASCACNADTVPCTVLDPFAGAGTTLLAAERLQRDGIGIELNPAYAVMARDRVTADCPLFAVSAAE